MSQGNYNATADVFSFGIVISEGIAATEAEEIVDDTRTSDFGLDVQKVKKLYNRSPNKGLCMIIEKLIDLAGWCCNLDPSKRPTTDQISGRLQRIQLEYQAQQLKSTSPRASKKTVAPCSPTSGSISDPAAFLMSPVKSSRIAISSLQDSIQILTDDDEDFTIVSDEEEGAIEVIPTVDPRIQEAATRIFEMVDRNKDGYLHYEETQLLAKLSEDYDLSQDAYNSICTVVGAHSDKGLSQEQVIKMYTHLRIGDATADLQKLHQSL